jgi:hypothetical protein
VIILYVFGALIALGAAALVGGGALLLRRVPLGQTRERWQEQVINPASAMLNALFLASFALSVVIAWQAYDHARADVAAEASALSGLYTAVTDLPDSGQLHREITQYAGIVVNREWPLLPAGGSSVAAGDELRQLSDQILAIPTDADAVQATRVEAIKQLDEVSTARDLRLQDATTALPAGLLVSLLITAVAVLGHGLIVGTPHSLSSAVTLMVEGALVAAAVFVVFVIRQPYHGAFDIGPDTIRQAMAHFVPSS